jgi:hypothetical protein
VVWRSGRVGPPSRTGWVGARGCGPRGRPSDTGNRPVIAVGGGLGCSCPRGQEGAGAGRWVGSESQTGRCLPDLRSGGAAGPVPGPGRPRRPVRAGAPRGRLRSAGQGGGGVDERGAVCARRAGRARLGGIDRGRAAGRGVGAVGVQDRQARRARAGGAVAAGTGAGDLAADARAAPRAGDLALAGCTSSSTARRWGTGCIRR